MVEKIAHSAQPKAGITMVETLNNFFGDRTIGELNGQLQRDFAKQRRSQSMARRELETLTGQLVPPGVGSPAIGASGRNAGHLTPEGVIKLSMGKKKHVLLKPA
jgi:hypothetical protein